MDTGSREGSVLASTWALHYPPFGLPSDPSLGYGEQLGVRFDQNCTGGRSPQERASCLKLLTRGTGGRLVGIDKWHL